MSAGAASAERMASKAERLRRHRFAGDGLCFFDPNLPFTTSQLEALVIPEVFPIIDWPKIFNVRETPLREALIESYLDPRYSSIALSF